MSGAWLLAFNLEPPKRRSSHPQFSIDATEPRRGSFELDVVLAEGLTTSAILFNDFTRDMARRFFALWTEHVTNKTLQKKVDDSLFENQRLFNAQMQSNQAEIVKILMDTQNTLVERLSDQQADILDGKLKELNLILNNEEDQRRHVENVIDRITSRQLISVNDFLTPLRRRSCDTMDITSDKGVYRLNQQDIRKKRKERSRPDRKTEELLIRIDGFVSKNGKRLRVIPQELTDEAVVAYVKDSTILNEFSTNDYLQAFVSNIPLRVSADVARDPNGAIKRIDIHKIVRGPEAA